MIPCCDILHCLLAKLYIQRTYLDENPAVLAYCAMCHVYASTAMLSRTLTLSPSRAFLKTRLPPSHNLRRVEPNSMVPLLPLARVDRIL